MYVFVCALNGVNIIILNGGGGGGCISDNLIFYSFILFVDYTRSVFIAHGFSWNVKQIQTEQKKNSASKVKTHVF